jgi:hypothetical protein
MEIVQVLRSRRCPLDNIPWLNSLLQLTKSQAGSPFDTNLIVFSSQTPLRLTTAQSQSHIATDGQSVSKSWCRAPSGAHGQIFNTLWQLRSCFCVAPSLTRGRVCLLYMLLVLASAVFLRSEYLCLRFQTSFCRLLRLAGSRWRYSTPPPHGLTTARLVSSLYNALARTAYKTPFPEFLYFCTWTRSRGDLIILRSLPSNRCTRYNIM